MKYRSSDTRGILKNNWIESRRSFSNNSYWDPNYMNFGSIKVINDDILQPGNKVPFHEHINYDILGYIVSGQLEHVDSLGNVTTAKHDNIQHMWCGSGIKHSEQCTSNIPARYLQIWITPQKNISSPPQYQILQKPYLFDRLDINLNNDIEINCGYLSGKNTLETKGLSYMYIVNGSVDQYKEGDGLELDPGEFTADFDAEIILFNNC